jgi:CMP-N-acetylneuraminic acid synthetase
MTIAALIPMRAGSKRLPGKHLLDICGTTPADVAVNAALCCPDIKRDCTFVATNDPAIRDHLSDRTVVFFNRSEHSCTDDARTEDVVQEFVDQTNFDLVILIQATNIFTTAFDLAMAIRDLRAFKLDSLVSGVWLARYQYCRVKGYPSDIASADFDTETRPGLSKVRRFFVENGAFYIFKPEDFKRTGKLLNGSIGSYGMPFQSLVELDTQEDLEELRCMRQLMIARRTHEVEV